MLLKMWTEALLEWGKFLGYSWYISLRDIAMQMFTITITFVITLWLAIFIYGTFYYAYMPQVTHERPVILEFRTDCPEFQKSQQFCNFPSANFTLSKNTQHEMLSRGQRYVVTLELDMPESPVNQLHGMFMLQLQMYSHDGVVVGTAKRTSMLRYKSPLLQFLETIAFLPSLLLGSTEQRQLVEVEMFPDYFEDPYKPAVGAYIEVQSRSIEIYTARMRIHARFSGLRYLLFTWPWVSAFVGISVNMFFLCIIGLLSWYQVYPRSVREDEEEEDTASVDAPVSGTVVPGDERQRRVLAMLERERQKEREAVKREYGLTGLPASASVPHSLHRRSASSGRVIPASRAAETLSSTSLGPLTKERAGSFRTSWDFYAIDKDLLNVKDKSRSRQSSRSEHKSESPPAKQEASEKENMLEGSEQSASEETIPASTQEEDNNADLRQRKVQTSS